MTGGEGGAANPLDRLAAPVLAYAERLAGVQGEPQADLLRHAAVLLDRFQADAQRAGLVAAAVPPARYALALILDQKARANPGFDVQAWASGADRLLFDGRSIDTATIAGFVRKAAEAGPEFTGVERFLRGCLARLEGQRRAHETFRATNWTGMVAVLALAFGLAVFGWASLVEYRHHRDLTAVFRAEALDLGLDRSGPVPDLAGRLDALLLAVDQVQRGADRAPVRLLAGLTGQDAARQAGADYRAAVARHLPEVLARALGDAFADEGDPARLYDALRAWQILSGQADWQVAWLAGWAEDRAPRDPSLAGLAPHIRALGLPDRPLAAPDPELLAQARIFAAEADEAVRALLELRRASAVAALPGWRGDVAVPGLDLVMLRRSGLPVSAPMPGLFTPAGWDLARDRAAGLAVQAARAEAARLFSPPPPPRNDTPDRVMDLLQRETVARWSAYLADLRVRPFDNPETSVLVSGRLALAASPLEGVMRAIWEQAGGTDRRRSHAQQLSVAVEFGPMMQYVEQGQMAGIAALFAGLNVALGAMDRDAEDGQRRLMSVQDKAASIAALRQAPRVVVQIVEDTLAQTGAAHADELTNPLTRAWQREALGACTEAAAARFPFAEGAPDADPAMVARAFAPGGTLDRFFRGRAEPLLDMSQSPWRWKPEARFAGLSPGSAEFFQRAQTIGQGWFGADDALGAEMTMTALAERGSAFLTLGGQGGPVGATTDSLRIHWPGGEAAKGIEVRFQTPEGAALLAEAGPWGLLRLLGGLRLRERDEGRRYLVDLRSGGARLFLEVGFATPANPLSVQRLVRGFACPQVL